MYLTTSIYDKIQRFIIGNGFESFERFQRLMGLKRGDSVLDFGCGTGIISELFSKNKINYVGIDLDESRINFAANRFKNLEFYCKDLNECDNHIDFTNVIAHGVLHHMSDSDIFCLIELLKKRGCRFFGCMEPVLPLKWFHNPLGYMVCKMDDGDFIRHKGVYQELFRNRAKSVKSEVFRWRFWPTDSLLMVVEF